MKNNKKGFTLIELLAVIVILAIITVLATRTLLPIFQDSGKDGFAINANEVRNVSADLMSLYLFKKDELSAANVAKLDNTNTGTACLTIQDLKDEGLIKIGDEYKGNIRVKKSGAGYAYYVNLYSESSGLYVQQCKTVSGSLNCSEGSLEKTDVLQGSSKTGDKYNAPDSTFTC